MMAKPARHLQTIVIGGGAIGAATAYQLARQGQSDVLLLEQYDAGHGQGASDDHSRVIRQSYHEPSYSDLARAGYAEWETVEAASGQPLLTRTGGLIIVEDSAGERPLERTRQMLVERSMPFETLSKSELQARFPQWQFEAPRVDAIYEPDSGIIDIRRATQTHLALAEALGVSVRTQAAARAIESTSDGVLVFTDDEAIAADRVVVCAASWTDVLLKPLGQTWTTTISQEQVLYLATPHLAEFAVGTFPVWAWKTENDLLYGFPTYGEAAIKISRDMSGRFVTHQTRSFEPVAEETALLRDFVRDHLPRGLGRELLSKTCVYDMPPDRNFILDALPGHPHVIVGVGAGHAAKFAALLGRILAEIAISGRSEFPIEAFRSDRLALRDPTFANGFELSSTHHD